MLASLVQVVLFFVAVNQPQSNPNPEKLPVVVFPQGAVQSRAVPTATPANRNRVVLGGATLDNVLIAFGEGLGPGEPIRAILVRAVDPRSAAGGAGMWPGDLLVAVNGIPVETISELRDTLWRLGLDPITFQASRNGIPYAFTISLR